MKEWLLSVVENQMAKFDMLCMLLWGLWQAQNSGCGRIDVGYRWRWCKRW